MNFQKFPLPCLPKLLQQRILRDNLPDLTKNPSGVSFRYAKTGNDYISCFRLLHDVYAAVGYVQPSSPPLRIIQQHLDPETLIIMGFIKDTLVYTAILFPDNQLGLPIDSAFKKQVDALREQGRRLVEVGCLVSPPDYRKGNQSIPMLCNQIVHLTAINRYHADDLLITTHPKYLKIYEDILLFEQIGGISKFSYVNDNPAVALRQDLRTAPQRYKEIYGNKPIEKNLHHFFFGSK